MCPKTARQPGLWPRCKAAGLRGGSAPPCKGSIKSRRSDVLDSEPDGVWLGTESDADTADDADAPIAREEEVDEEEEEEGEEEEEDDDNDDDEAGETVMNGTEASGGDDGDEDDGGGIGALGVSAGETASERVQMRCDCG